MMIYFHPQRFEAEFSDCITCETLEEEVATKSGGTVMPAKELIAKWLKDRPQGSIEITAETK